MIEPGREQLLRRLALFSDLEAGELRALANVNQVVQVPASALIFREGETGDCALSAVRCRSSPSIGMATKSSWRSLRSSTTLANSPCCPAAPAVATRAFVRAKLWPTVARCIGSRASSGSVDLAVSAR